MRFELAEKERKLLQEIQRNEKTKRDYVKVTVLLMLDLGQSPPDIALFLGIAEATVYRHLENYQAKGLDKYLENNIGIVEYALARNISPALIADYETILPDKKLLQAKLEEFAELFEARKEIED